jgi:hypothetical protein
MPGGGSKPGERRGGRKPGTPNLRKIEDRKALLDYCHEKGTDPFKVMVDLMATPKMEPRIKIACAEALADRLMPKLKSIEITGDMTKPLYVVTDGVTSIERAARQAKIEELLAKRDTNAIDSI